MKMEQSVPKRRHIKFRLWGIAENKECNFSIISNVTGKGNIFLNNELQSLKVNFSTRIKYLKNIDRDLSASVSRSFRNTYFIVRKYECKAGYVLGHIQSNSYQHSAFQYYILKFLVHHLHETETRGSKIIKLLTSECFQIFLPKFGSL